MGLAPYPMRDQIFEYLARVRRPLRRAPPRAARTPELLDAHWVAQAQRWELETSTGPVAARVLVIAPGLLKQPFTPALPGLEGFPGNAFTLRRGTTPTISPESASR